MIIMLVGSVPRCVHETDGAEVHTVFVCCDPRVWATIAIRLRWQICLQQAAADVGGVNTERSWRFGWKKEKRVENRLNLFLIRKDISKWHHCRTVTDGYNGKSGVGIRAVVMKLENLSTVNFL